MLTFNEDGSTDIDFPDGPIHVHAPTFGSLKRLRSERVRLSRIAQDQLAAWENEHPEPTGESDGENDTSEPDPVAVARRAEDRIVAAEGFNLAATEAWWRLLLVGDDTFKGLADSAVPENTDDWPAALLFDIRPIIPPNSSVEVILSAQSMPDQWMRHAGNGRSRSGPTNGAGPTPSQ